MNYWKITRQQLKTTSMIRKIVTLLLLFLCICLVSDLGADSKKTVKKNKLTCEYFDSLKDDSGVCAHVNHGRETTISPEGKNKESYLYKTAFKVFNSTPKGREAIAESGGVIPFKAWMIDLDEDGIEEAILVPWNDNFCGASGNCDILIYKSKTLNKRFKWELIGAMSGNMLHIERSKNNQYYDIITDRAMGAEDQILTRYTMSLSSKRYQVVEQKEVYCRIKSLESCFRVRR